MTIESRTNPSKLFVVARFLAGQSRKCLAFILCATIALFANLLAGCGGGMKPGPVTGQSTKVTLLFSSTANAQISAFQMSISSVTLTSKSGNTVTIYQQPQSVSPSQVFFETIHSNGDTEPLGTVSIPQDVYTSANVVVAGARFTFVTFDAAAKTLAYNSFSNGPNLASKALLPSSITVSGDAATLLLDLQVSQSASFTAPPPLGTSSITPVFKITPVAVAAQPTNNQNGKVSGVHGRVASINSNTIGFSLALPDGPTLPVNFDSSTVFQEPPGVSALGVGWFVDIDAVVRPDGSLRATRIEIEDISAHDVMIGPLTNVASAFTVLSVMDLQQQGDDYCCAPDPVGNPFRWDSSTVFRVTGQLGNLQNLPFTASFNATNISVGQKVSIASATVVNSGSPFTLATTITLVPQTINGTVSAVSSSGGFTVYSVTLAPNDLIPTLTGNGNVTAYVGSNTQVITSSPITVGSVVRFNGLLFNDNGVLRMVSGQVSDGVTP
jgi:hypothetical protein